MKVMNSMLQQGLESEQECWDKWKDQSGRDNIRVDLRWGSKNSINIREHKPQSVTAGIDNKS